MEIFFLLLRGTERHLSYNFPDFFQFSPNILSQNETKPRNKTNQLCAYKGPFGSLHRAGGEDVPQRRRTWGSPESSPLILLPVWWVTPRERKVNAKVTKTLGSLLSVQGSE